MFRHDYIPVNIESVIAAHSLQGRLEELAAFLAAQQKTAMVTAEGDEMTLPAVVKAG